MVILCQNETDFFTHTIYWEHQMVTYSTLRKGEDTIAEEKKKVLKWGSKNDMGSPEVTPKSG